MDRSLFATESERALAHIEGAIAALDTDEVDPDLAADVLTLEFSDGAEFVINAHSAAGQIWMAAGTSAWHFDLDPASKRWVASRTGEELMATVARVVGDKLGRPVEV